MRARAVIGANFGDEAKGLVTDYLCATEGAGMVVRYCSGANAGHTVVAPDGTRHVFGHFGSGTLAGVPTFLSQFFVCNPLLFLKELDKLAAIGVRPTVYAHPNCLVTTFADMAINQALEDVRARSTGRHGSCGVGVSETIERSRLAHLKITLSDLWNGIDIRGRLSEICSKYSEFRTGKPIANNENMIEAFSAAAAQFADLVHPLGIGQCKDPVFEGAQGLLLSEDNTQYFPHVTRAHTGIRNVKILCEQAGITQIDAYYVSRTYLTRHGAGPFPGENLNMRFHDNTNLDHQYQGQLRFAPLVVGDLFKRCVADFGGPNYKVVLTHCDQLKAPCPADLYSFGPTRDDVRVRLDSVDKSFAVIDSNAASA